MTDEWKPESWAKRPADDWLVKPPTKRCSGCQTEKPHEAFAKNRSRADGLQQYCRACGSEYHYRKTRNMGV